MVLNTFGAELNPDSIIAFPLIIHSMFSIDWLFLNKFVLIFLSEIGVSITELMFVSVLDKSCGLPLTGMSINDFEYSPRDSPSAINS